MTKIISYPKENPKTKMGWWAFGLSVAIIFGGPFLGVMAAVVVPLLTSYFGERVARVAGFGAMFFTAALLGTALAVTIKAFRAGERSWAVWFAVAVSGLQVAFWAFMILGEFIWPH